MRLYIHIGTEKTGSSFIQSVFANDRSRLVQKGIHFPRANKYEREMKAGRITPGNGERLMQVLKEGREKATENLLKAWRDEAKGKQCNIILVSNETLIQVLSDNRNMELLLLVCNNIGLEPPSFLLVIRDPVDQAISLYKHRAKSGEVSSLRNWLKKRFDLPHHLSGFFSVKDSCGLDVMVKKYRKSGKHLIALFYEDWLNVIPPEKWTDQSVNASLSFSELAVIRGLRMSSPQLVPYYYRAMLSVSNTDKADETALIKSYKAIVNNELLTYNNVWNCCNQYLKGGEVVQIPNKAAEQEEGVPLVFSDKQINSWLELWSRSRKVTFRIKAIWDIKLRPLLAYIKWKGLGFLFERI